MLYLKLSQNPGHILCAVQYILAAYFTIFLCKSSLYLSVPTLTFSLLPLSHWQNLPQSKSFDSDAVQCIRFSFHGLCFQGQVQTRMFCLALNLTGLPGGTVVKNPPANTGDAGDSGSTLGLGGSPGGRSGNPLQHPVQFRLSVTANSASPRTAARQASLSITISRSLLKLMSIEVMPSNHLILCLPLLRPSIFPGIGVFSNESVLHIRWLMYWSFSFSISSTNEYSGPISFRIIAWRIPWTEKPSGLQSMESQRVGHNRATEHKP